MPDELDILFAHLLRAKTAIEPLASVAEIWPSRTFFEAAAGPFIRGLRASYLEDPRAANQVVGAVVPKVVSIVNSIEYAAFNRDVRRIHEQSFVLCNAFQGLPGRDAFLPELTMWEGLPGPGGGDPEEPTKSPKGPTTRPPPDPKEVPKP
jgi:hypothetical protein